MKVEKHLKQKYTKQKHHPQAKSDEAMMMAYAQWMKIWRKKVWIVVKTKLFQLWMLTKHRYNLNPLTSNEVF